MWDIVNGMRAYLTGGNEVPKQHKLSQLVSDLKGKLADPRLSTEDKQKIAEMIVRIETNASSAHKKATLINTALAVPQVAAGLLFGPVGTGVAVMSRTAIESPQKQVLSARKIAGRRIKHNRKVNSAPTHSKALVAGVTAAGVALVTGVAMAKGESLLSRVFDLRGFLAAVAARIY